METIGEIIRAARGSRDQAWLAKQLNVSPASIGHWERGERTPRVTRFEEIETVLDLHPGTLSKAWHSTQQKRERSINTALGEAIKEARGDRDQQWLASHLDVSRSTISAWERGERMPLLSRYEDIEQALSLAPGTLSAIRFAHFNNPSSEELLLDLTTEELLDVFTQLDKRNKEALLTTAKALLETQN